MSEQTEVSQMSVEDVAGHFVLAFGRMQIVAHSINVANGWWDKRRAQRAVLKAAGYSEQDLNALFGINIIGLQGTELSEGIESLRKPTNPIDSTAPHSLARELAGCIVRIMDFAQEYKIPVARALVDELDNNAGRGHMHGGNVA